VQPFDARWHAAAGPLEHERSERKEAVMSNTITQPATPLTESQLRRSMRYYGQRAHPSNAKAAVRSTQARVALRNAPAAKSDHLPAPKAGITSVSDSGIAFMAGFEGFSAKPYWDAIGRVWTIGFGETHGVTGSTPPVTRAQALAKLRARVNHDYLAPALHVADAEGLQLRPCEADALASLAYNCGPGVFDQGRTMGTALRSKNRAAIAAAFLVYDKGGAPPVPIAGLTRRRKAERAMFLS
jgi:GH24 family phage-related lysozyme (muramidase)